MYYDLTYQCLSSVNIPVELLHGEANPEVAAVLINKFYAEIVRVLSCAAS